MCHILQSTNNLKQIESMTYTLFDYQQLAIVLGACVFNLRRLIKRFERSLCVSVDQSADGISEFFFLK